MLTSDSLLEFAERVQKLERLARLVSALNHLTLGTETVFYVDDEIGRRIEIGRVPAPEGRVWGTDWYLATGRFEEIEQLAAELAAEA